MDGRRSGLPSQFEKQSKKSKRVPNTLAKTVRVFYLILFLAIFTSISSASFSAVDVSAAEGQTETLESTPSPIATEDLTQTPPSDPTITPTFPPTVTITPTVTISPTVTVTPTSTPTQDPTIGFTLTLTSFPEEATPGGILTLIWDIGDWGKETGVEMQVTVPAGLTPEEGYPGFFDPESGILTFNPEESVGKLGWVVDKNAYGPYEISSRLFLNKTEVDSAILVIYEAGVNEISLTGGTAVGMEDQVMVVVPDGALAEPIDLRIQTPFDSPPPNSLSGRPFRLTALGQTTGDPIKEFSQPLAVQVAYDESDLAGTEGSLTLFYYDELLATWVPLESSVDTENNILTGYTDHFSDFDIDVTSWQAARTPTMESFQVAQFTGAATYAMPFWMPPGPGGFQPSVSLSYNSQVVDSARADTQASWVGMGWSLDAGGAIERDMHGTNDYLEDDTFYLVVGGVSSLLLPVTGNPGGANTVDYHLTDENFWRVRYYEPDYGGASADTWAVWDKTGTTYYFGKNSGSNNSRARYPQRTGENGCDEVQTTWRWGLSEAKNLFGQSITYTYTLDPKTNIRWGYPCNSWHTGHVAMYPDTILYPHGQYRVKFVTESRLDFDPAWETDYSYVLYEDRRLDTVQIQRLNGSWTTIREYDLTYATANWIYPNVNWQANGKTTTLVAVTEYGYGGKLAGNDLPSMTFTYDGAHLDTALNGYGGKVDFNYAAWHETEGAPDSRIETMKFNTTQECLDNPPTTHDWTAAPGTPAGAVHCDGPDMAIESENSPYHEAKHYMYSHLIQPGGVYIITAQVETTGNARLKFGIRDNTAGVNYYDATWHDTGGSMTWVSATITLPNGIHEGLELRMACDGDGASGSVCLIREYKITLAPMRNRVVSKTLFPNAADSSTSYTFTYSYSDNGTDSGKTNRPSIYSGGANPYIDLYAEFRGNGYVAETAPDGMKTVTRFHQNDTKKGRPYEVKHYDSTGKLIGAQYTDYAATAPINVTRILPSDYDGSPQGTYTGLFLYWTRVISQENHLCDGIPCVKTRQTFAYNLSQDQEGTYENNEYGNLTRTLDQRWNGSAWVDYRGSRIWYAPNGGTPYLVSLPSLVNTFDCFGTPAGTCSTSSGLLTHKITLYDDATTYSTLPSVGKLTDVKVLVDFNGSGGSSRYNQISLVYDAYGNVSQQLTWNNYAAQTTDPTGSARVNNLFYDGTYHTYMVEFRNPLYNVSTFPAMFITYDYDKAVTLSITDANGQVVSGTYDAWGRLVKIVRPGDTSGSPTVSITYADSYPFQTVATQKIDSSVSMSVEKYYDGLGRLLQMQLANAKVLCGSGETDCDIVTDYYYDTQGRPWKQSIPYAVTVGTGYSQPVTQPFVETRYDEAGRVEESYGTDGSLTQTTYSLNASTQTHQITVTDPLGNSTVTHADVWGRVIEVHLEADPWTRYSYDAADRLTKVEQMSGTDTILSGFTTTIAYDYASRKISMTDPDMGSWTYAYDAVGNLTSLTDARLCQIDFFYDPLDRLTNKKYDLNTGVPQDCFNTPNVTYTYDTITPGYHNIGERTQMSDEAGNTTTYQYDGRSQLVVQENTISGSGTFKTLYEFNSAGRLYKMTYPANNTGGTGELLTYTYLRQGTLDTVATSYALDFYVKDSIYDSAGRLETRHLGNNGHTGPYLFLNYDYYPWGAGTAGNDQGRLQRLQAGTSSGNPTNLLNLEYTYDVVGNVKTILDVVNSNQKQCFAYDNLYRLTNAAVGANDATCSGTTPVNGEYPDETYTYNTSNGTLASKTGLGNYTYNGTHVHAVAGTGSGNSYTYDSNGNQTSRTVGGVTHILIYDAENQLITVKQGSTTIASFVYDGDGNRIKSTIGGVTTSFVGDWFEWTGSTSTMVKYYSAGDQLIAMRVGGTSNSAVKWLLGDHLGSTSVSTNYDGTSPVTQLYKPWGEVRYSSGSLPTSYTYNGQYSNAANFGLMFYNARWYDPVLGRFVQADTIIPNVDDPKSYDRYAYVYNNPLNFTDPSGHCGEVVIGPGGQPFVDPNCDTTFLADLFQALIVALQELIEPPQEEPTSTSVPVEEDAQTEGTPSPASENRKNKEPLQCTVKCRYTTRVQSVAETLKNVDDKVLTLDTIWAAYEHATAGPEWDFYHGRQWNHLKKLMDGIRSLFNAREDLTTWRDEILGDPTACSCQEVLREIDRLLNEIDKLFARITGIFKEWWYYYITWIF